MQTPHGVAVVGSGPNGLAAAVTIARAGIPVTVFEAADTVGGGARTTEHVVAGVRHDVCSAIHPMALATEFFQRFELERRMRFVVPDASYAHPLDLGGNSRAAIAYRDLERTADELGRDGRAYQRLLAPVVGHLDGIVETALGGSLVRWPRDLAAAAVLAARTVEQGTPLWGIRFQHQEAPALLAGVAAHNVGTMPSLAGAGVGLVLGGLGHAAGWPVPVGGSQAITDAMLADLLAHGGRVTTGHRVRSVGELDGFAVKIFDTSARALADLAGELLPPRFARALRRFRYGDAAAKVSFVLDGPIPWADARVAAAPTVHLGGSRRELQRAEAEVARGKHSERPYVLLAQPTAADPGRNPAGVHAVTSYAHVPHGSTRDMAELVSAQIERFAPGFRDRIVHIGSVTAAQLAAENANYVGGDFSAGQVQLRQLLQRPVVAADPWRTPAAGVYLCSSSTAPGPGVHGLSGFYAARSALAREFGLPVPKLSLS